MLQKVIEIKSIGRFQSFKASGDVTLKKLTLIHAENGRGKTTFCAILRSLKSGQPFFIAERQTLGCSDPESVKLLVNGNAVQLSSRNWNSTIPGIAVFDSVFVHNNVYSGDQIDHEHKKNLYRLIIGSTGVSLANKVDTLDAKIREINTDIRNKKAAVESLLPTGLKLDKYLGLGPILDIEDKIKQKNEQINTAQKVIDKSAEIQAKGLLKKLQVPSIPTSFLITLKKQLKDVMLGAETKVKQHMATSMNRPDEAWLSQGLGNIKTDVCPFCGSDIKLNQLVAAYKSYFNQEYNNLKVEINGLGRQVEASLSVSSISSVEQSIYSNQALIEFWKQFCDDTFPQFKITEFKAAYAKLLEECHKVIKDKQANPLDAVEPKNDFANATALVQVAGKEASEYNAFVDRYNEKISKQKSLALQGVDLSKPKAELLTLQVIKNRFEPGPSKACEEYRKVLLEKAKIEVEKNKTKEKLDNYCESILKTYESDINTYLDQFNVGFRIVNTRHLYTGGTPSSHYQIAINDCPVELGDSRTQPGTPCFKTTLSSGDRNALAFAFFLASLKHDPHILDKIVVFDDPFTSLDRFRRVATQQLICQLVGSVKQVIVLSHDPFFLKLIWDGYPLKGELKTLQMSKSKTTTFIGEWDIIAETRSGYLKDFSVLLDFYCNQRGDCQLVVRSIRPFLEAWLRNHFPGQFLDNEWLGDFINKIRNCDSTCGLSHAKSDLTEIEGINDYSKRYHHAPGDTIGDGGPIETDELHGFVKRTLQLVGGL